VLQGTALTGVGLAGIGLVGCGDDDDDTGGTATPGGGQTPGASPTADTGTPKAGGTFRHSLPSPPVNWDPYVNSANYTQVPWSHFTSRLLKYASGPEFSPGDLTLEPDTLEAMPEQVDATTVSLKLRPEVKFHNVAPMNGRTLTADDITFSIQRYMDIGSNKARLGIIDSFEATDELTVTIKLKSQSASFVSSLADAVMLWIMAPEFASNEIGPTDPKVGVGPFMFDSYQTDVQMNYVRHPEYFLTGKPYFGRIEQSIISEEATIDSQFRSGTLDRVNLSDKGRLEEIQRSVTDVQIEEYSALSMPRVDLAAHTAPFNDLDVRRAISMAFDRDELALATDSIGAQWATHAFGAGYQPWYIDPRSPDFGEAGRYFQANVEEASRMISAKYPDGIEADYYLTPDYLGSVLMAEYLADRLSQIGVRINIVSMSYTEYQNRFRTGAIADRLPQGMVDERFASRSDPTGWFADYHAPSASRQIVQFQDDELERMMAEQELELDLETRIAMVHDIQRRMADQMWGVPLNSETGVNLTQKRVRNYFHKLDHGFMAEGGVSAWLEDA